jgi:hypothetical protein
MAGSSTIRLGAFVFAGVDRVSMTTQLEEVPLGVVEFDAVGLFDASDPDAPPTIAAKSYHLSSIFTSDYSAENCKLFESCTKDTRPS